MVDAKREADRAGLAFGKVVDPVGEAVERALAVLHRAVALGRGEAFAEGALRAIWSQGADLTQDRPLCALALQAGLTAEDVKTALGDESWRAPAEANRLALLDAGLWGAPTFRVDGGRALWGQDRLWAVEAELKRAAALEPS
jgi:2-hydroxychromene-2-carboxylate isomerase